MVILRWLRRLVCRHSTLALNATGPAMLSPRGAEFRVFLPGIEVKCSRCAEFWHVELDATESMKSALAAEE